MPENHKQGYFNYFYGELETCNIFRTDKIADDPADEEISTGAIESIFSCATGVGATQNASIGVLPTDHRFSFRNRIVSSCKAFPAALIAIHQTLKGDIRRHYVSGFGGLLSAIASSLTGSILHAVRDVAFASSAIDSALIIVMLTRKSRRGDFFSCKATEKPHNLHINFLPRMIALAMLCQILEKSYLHFVVNRHFQQAKCD